MGEREGATIRVTEIFTGAFSGPGNDVPLVWPDVSSKGSGGNGSNEYNSSPKCALLIQDTEIVVKPKTRSKKKIPSWSDPFRLIPSDADWGESFGKLTMLTGRGSFHVDPGCVLIKTEQWPFQSIWAQIKSDRSNQISVVRVVTSSRIPPQNAVLFIGTRLDLQLSLHRDSVCLRPLTATREEPVENIVFEEVHLANNPRNMTVWNVPNIDLADSYGESNIPIFCGGSDPTFYPVGAVVPTRSNVDVIEEMDFLDQWFRITVNEAYPHDEGHVVGLNADDITYLWKRRRRRYEESFCTLAVPETPTIYRPREIIMSSDWTKSIIDCTSHFSSIFVTMRGPSGSGKTYNALLLSALISFSFHRPIFYLDCKSLQKSKPRMSGILEEIDLVFAQALDTKDSIILLDDVDSLSPNLVGGDDQEMSGRTHAVNPAAIDQSKLIGDRLSHLYEAVELKCANDRDSHVSLIATCSSPDSINPSILKSFQGPLNHIKVPLLSAEDRSDLLVAINRRHHPMSRFDFDRSNISRRTEGFFPRDFEKLSLRAIRSFQTNSSILSFQDSLVAELATFTPMTQISNSKNECQSFTSWANIGGLFDVKMKLESIVRHPLLYRRIYARARMQLPRGILLYGPSGCGKSYLVPALANECNYPIITCNGAEVLDKYIGASEAKVRELFERASQMAPSILFLDELEALAPRRGSDSTGVTDRVVNQLLTFLDGVEDVSSGTVFIIGATSRPDKVDPAIVRPGRLERHLYVGPPESGNEWSDLLIKIAKNWNLKPETLRSLSNENEVTEMVSDIPRLCPADICAAFSTAHLNAFHRTLIGGTPPRDIEKIEIGTDDIKSGIRETKPSLSEEEGRLLESLYKSFTGFRPDLNADSKVNIRELKTSLR
mmetsp:Transcript_120792/g.246818  ORF Transcript_120792/g.246818 Transcript_120792/m.246818 type:complete len:888 (+) Transcript_120792:15-2678(+)